MEQKTYVYMTFPFKRMVDNYNYKTRMLCEMLTTGSVLLSHDEVCDFLAYIEGQLDGLLGHMVTELLRRNDLKEEEMKKTHPMIDIKDLEFSKRRNEIMEILDANPKYVSLRKERETLFFIEGKMTAAKRKANERRLKEIETEIGKMYQEEASKKEPMTFAELSPVEQYMLLWGNDGIRTYICQKEKKALLYKSDRYFLQEQMHNTMYLGNLDEETNDDEK